MIAKECPFCHGISYSANDSGSWECPYCKRLITQADEKSASDANND